jgi:hypothetical protein
MRFLSGSALKPNRVGRVVIGWPKAIRWEVDYTRH